MSNNSRWVIYNHRFCSFFLQFMIGGDEPLFEDSETWCDSPDEKTSIPLTDEDPPVFPPIGDDSIDSSSSPHTPIGHFVLGREDPKSNQNQRPFFNSQNDIDTSPNYTHFNPCGGIVMHTQEHIPIRGSEQVPELHKPPNHMTGYHVSPNPVHVPNLQYLRSQSTIPGNYYFTPENLQAAAMFLMSNAVATNSPDQRSSSYQHLLDPRARETMLPIFCNRSFIHGRFFVKHTETVLNKQTKLELQLREYFKTSQHFSICFF